MVACYLSLPTGRLLSLEKYMDFHRIYWTLAERIQTNVLSNQGAVRNRSMPTQCLIIG